MSKTILIFLVTVLLSFSAVAQDKIDGKAQPTEKDKTEAIPSGTYLKRGVPLGNSQKVALADVLKDPNRYAGKTVRVKGIIVRSCKMEGCWAELAADKNSRYIRVKMKDHAFFIPLQSAGAVARAEGVFSVKTLSKAQVDHMIEEDGAKFDNRNADGTVTEVSFEATGIELKKAGE